MNDTAHWIWSRAPGLASKLVNLRARLRGYKHRFGSTSEDGLFLLTDGKQDLMISRPNRHRMYRRGVGKRIDALANTYHLTGLPDLNGGTLIDCGTNIGELGVWAKAAGMQYIAFEPEEQEARCADINAFGGAKETRRLALWNETKTLKFYHKPEAADGSLIEMDAYNDVTEIPAVRLDEALTADMLTGPVVLKIEAEGAEPEVLEGATALLPHIDYITIDCGPERGKDEQHTVIETCQFLIGQGFMPEAAKLARPTFLYRNLARTKPLA